MADTNFLYCKEDQVLVESPGTDQEKRIELGTRQPYLTMYNKVGDLYRAALREHGRCLSYVMVDIPTDQPTRSIRVGWVFARRPRVYGELINPRSRTLLETWITVYQQPPVQVWTPGTYAKVG